MLINHVGGFAFQDISQSTFAFQNYTCMKKILAVFYCVFFFQIGFSQTGTIKGTISDAKTKETLIGAYVFNLNDKTNGTSTDVDGNFSFKANVGLLKIVASYTGLLS